MLPTTSENRTIKENFQVEESISAGDISVEMEVLNKAYKLKQIEYDNNEPDRYAVRDLIPVINEYRQRIKEYDTFLIKLKSDKRDPDRNRNNKTNKCAEQQFTHNHSGLNIQVIIDENNKLQKMLESYRKMIQQSKITIESQERMLEKYSANAIAYVKLNESHSNRFHISSNNPTNPTLNTQGNVSAGTGRTNSSFQSPQRGISLSRPTTGTTGGGLSRPTTGKVNPTLSRPLTSTKK